MKTAIVTTTINIPTLLDQYARDCTDYEHKDVCFIVTGDLKTNHQEIRKLFEKLSSKYDYEFIYMDPADQDQYLIKFEQLASHLPWNSVMRRNVSILKAYELGYESIITIDDDNYVEKPNYLDGHAAIGQEVDIEIISSANGWFNICDYLEEKNEREFFVRGYPLKYRRYSTFDEKVIKCGRGRIVVNGGFWLGDPDIDAVTRLSNSIDAISYKRNNNFALAPGTYCPFNSQNTALHKDVIPAYFLSPFVGRYDDIWASYITKRIADYMGDLVSFGYPIVRQDRNDHDLWHDAGLERMGMALTEIFCDDWLRNAPIVGDNYLEATDSLLDYLAQRLKTTDPIVNGHKNQLNLFLQGYKVWLTSIAKITN